MSKITNDGCTRMATVGFKGLRNYSLTQGPLLRSKGQSGEVDSTRSW